MLITTINDVNRSVFERLAPKEMIELLTNPGYFALGAIGEDEKGKYAAGVLIFEVTEGYNGEENMIGAILHWLYVAEEFRERGAADALMEELFRILGEAEIEMLCCDLPLGSEHDLLCAYLEEWGFRFSFIEKYECDVLLEEVMRNPFFQRKPKNRVSPLSEYSKSQQIQNIRQFQKLDMMPVDLEEQLPYCDMDISCGIGDHSVINGLLMVKKITEDSLELLTMRSLKGKPEQVMDLLLFAAKQASVKYGPKTRIHIRCGIPAAADLIAFFLPDAQPYVVRRGVMALLEEDGWEEEVE